MRPPLSGAVKVSRFEFTEGSGWFELLAVLQLLGSEARDPSPSPPPTLLALPPPRGRMGRVPPAGHRGPEEGKQGRGPSLGSGAPLVQPAMVGRLLGPIPLAGGTPGSLQLTFSPTLFLRGPPGPCPDFSLVALACGGRRTTPTCRAGR